MAIVKEISGTTRTKRARPLGKPIPAEGENGVFTESWFVICPSFEVKPGQIIGKPFLDGRVVVFRDENGVAHVLSAYCTHLGTDLSTGKIVDGHIRCPFHYWHFDKEGTCVKTGLGDPPPKSAGLFKFPTVERFGLIWAFNGEEPWWDIPGFPVDDGKLDTRVVYDVPEIPVDPWVICANTPDWQHLRVVHRIDLDPAQMSDSIEWTDHSMTYSFKARMEHGSGEELEITVGIFGTSIFRMYGKIGGQWYGVFTAFGMPRPGVTQNHFSSSVEKGDGSPEDQARIDQMHAFTYMLGKFITNDDRPILHSAKYRPGALTKNDSVLARYFDMVRNFPRSHVAADYIK